MCSGINECLFVAQCRAESIFYAQRVIGITGCAASSRFLSCAILALMIYVFIFSNRNVRHGVNFSQRIAPAGVSFVFRGRIHTSVDATVGAEQLIRKYGDFSGY